ncbi:MULTISPECIES: MATE family efflux transporter [unclassified Aureimonas]|uniref:MATE family efflux transporter n=1 Tax=unclassified Aureimonas TaxID=2615206 RepID=UPI0006FC0048|nr:MULTISPECIES: MATE family efflux transporter [unclassified Aureimonas]KQT64469.1 MATE family efflux transporter [Aureimonas sp. Leaf427]KQT81657.1 MATE family efflux transporter [Aureimonas sp. Leaf460]
MASQPVAAGDASGTRPDGTSFSGHIGQTLMLGLPLAGAQLAQMSINVTDTALIGRLGPEPLAAAVLAAQTFFLVWMFGAGFAQAVMPVAAAAAGRGDVPGIRRSVRMGLWVVLLYGALVMVPLWHTEAILLALGQEPRVSALAGAFMRILQWSMFPALLLVTLRSYLGVLDRANVILAITVFGAILNGALDVVLIFGHLGAPALGMAGAAYASVTANIAMALIVFLYTWKAPGLAAHELYVRFWRPDWQAFAEVLRLGWPISTTIVAEVGLFAAASILMGWLGTIQLAAHGIALQLASIAFMIPLGLASAGTIRVGQAYGAEDWTGVGRAGTAALVLAVGIAFVGALFFWIIPEALISLYLDRNDPNAAAVLAFGAPLLFVAAAFQFVDGLQVVASGLLRGLKDTRIPMLIALFSYWVIGMPVAYLLAFKLGFGGPGVWIGLASGLLCAAVLMTARFQARARLGLTPR